MTEDQLSALRVVCLILAVVSLYTSELLWRVSILLGIFSTILLLILIYVTVKILFV